MSSDDQLPEVDLSDKFGTGSGSGAARRVLSGVSLPSVGSQRRRPPARQSPAAVATAPPQTAPKRERPPAARPPRRASKQAEPAAGEGAWGTQTINVFPAAAAAALDAETAERGVSKADVFVYAVDTHLDDAVKALASARAQVRAPVLPVIAGEQAPTRLVVRIREADRERFRAKVESELSYRGALSDAYRWCLLTFLAGK